MSFVPHEKYMRRCIELALKGGVYTAPNPMVGAVLVHNDRIIGEGWHQQYGGPHAEVNCFNSVSKEDEEFLHDAVLYVSLEPCAHFGKTPPCADLIIGKGVRKVVVGIRDPFTEVNGKGIEKLQHANIEVIAGCLEEECFELNKRFFCFHTKQRPYIILKWAQTANGIIGSGSGERLMISSTASNTLVHKWRSEESAILVGTNTAFLDDPQLNVRNWRGASPVRMVIDRELKLPTSLQIFSDTQRTVVLNEKKDVTEGNLIYRKTSFSSFPQSIIQICNEMNLLSIFIEGGAKTLQTFIDAELWDEARVISNEKMNVDAGVMAPVLSDAEHINSNNLTGDRIDFYKRIE